MARPRLPDFFYRPPTEEEKARGETAVCHDCHREVHRRVMPYGNWLCLDCQRQYQRERYAAKVAKKRSAQ